MGTRHVVLVGGGHAHIQVLEALVAQPLAGARVTLVVDVPIAVYSGMVPGMVAGQYQAEDVQLDPVALARQAGASVTIGRATRVDPATRVIFLETGETVSYDLASFDVGSTVAGMDTPGVREHALPTRPIGRFVEEFTTILDVQRARAAGTPLRVVVVGGGAGGVELAFTLDHRLRLDTACDVGTMLVDGRARILSGYAETLRQKVIRRARQRGIGILTGTRIRRVGSAVIEADDGAEIPYDLLVWVTGAVSQPLFRDSGLPTDDRGFARVRSTLQFERQDDLFGVGDCATLVDYPATPKAGVYAVRQGPVLTRNLRAALARRPLEHYRPQSDFLTLLNLGGGVAIGAKWGVSFEGRWVMHLKDRIDRRFMQRFPHPPFPGVS